MLRFSVSSFSLGVICSVTALSAQAAPIELDPAFGNNGVASVAVDPSAGDEAQAIALDSNGNIVAAGYISAPGNAFAISRFTADGSLDTTFGSSGIVVNDLTTRPDGAYAVDIDASDNIIVAGRSNVGMGTGDFTLLKYTPAGVLDTSFGTNGVVTTSFSTSATPYAIGRDSNQRIILAGAVAGSIISLAAYSADGTLDTSFASSGTLESGAGHTLRDLAIDGSDRIIVGGFTANNASADFIVARYLSDGSLDTSFGNNGTVVSDLGDKDQIYGLTLDADGNIVVAGASGGGLAVARYTPDGTLDNTFAGNGWATADPSGANDIAYDVAIDPAGNIVVSGIGGPNFMLARFDSTGALDTTFNDTGFLVEDITGTNQQDNGYSLVLDSNGGFLVGGRKFNTTTSFDMTVARFQVGNAAPVASSVSVDGVAQVGSTLTGTYTYSDADSDPEGASQIRWRLDTNASGNNLITIPGADSLQYVIQPDAIGNFLFFCVTPVATSGTLTGNETCSPATAAVLADDDDGLDGSIEIGVPDPDGIGNGDGNGDTVPDNEQGNVTSLLQSGSSAYATLVSLGNLQLSAVTAQPAPAGLPASVNTPVGAFSFTATGAAPGATEDFELYIPFDPAITMALKENRLTGEWVDVADSITQVGNKTRISFSITNGGPFDADGDATNNQIQDPIVPASGNLSNTIAIPSLSQLGLLIMVLMMGISTTVVRRRKTIG
ncbi:choice-of-anchor U domain-containing protein [Halopseudomonas salegens]|uniref:Delta-60 repeat domain-containing protein n=1 Tax=Halopseudomonas salegens TaxID=1434072 RepID=A0A1H2FNN0_9GAMM|nr:choice-of-anchor U domain-containing protein [Halopseudomonas salegens]SDU08886.1 delta-60 repeat domain-containing protein [Halopseudomonas salegens]